MWCHENSVDFSCCQMKCVLLAGKKTSPRFHLCRADVAGCFVSADVLLSGLQSQSKHLLPGCISKVEICIFKELNPSRWKCMFGHKIVLASSPSLTLPNSCSLSFSSLWGSDFSLTVSGHLGHDTLKERRFVFLTLWLRPFGQASSSPGSLLQQRRQREDHRSKEEPQTSGSYRARCRIQTLREGAARIVPTGLWHSKPKPGYRIKALCYQAQGCPTQTTGVLLPLPCEPGPPAQWSPPPCRRCPDTGRARRSRPSRWSPSHEVASAPLSLRYSCNTSESTLSWFKLVDICCTSLNVNTNELFYRCTGWSQYTHTWLWSAPQL